jgi:hypothetical protein
VNADFVAAIEAAAAAALTRWRDDAPAALGEAVPFAVGWTTVDLGRAEGALAAAGHGLVGPFVDGANDDLIGATCRVADLGPSAVPGVWSIVLLEPSTEGLLTGSLARLGEGPAVVWLAAGVPVAARSSALSPVARGPFGAERLLRGPTRDGRLVLVVGDMPGTIAT